jgi:hypothetical protein
MRSRTAPAIRPFGYSWISRFSNSSSSALLFEATQAFGTRNTRERVAVTTGLMHELSNWAASDL